MRDHGVSAIQLSSNVFDISLPKQKRNNWISGTLGGFSDEFSVMLEKDEAAAELKIMEDLLVNVEVKLDGNTRAAADTQSFIEQVAENVLGDEEAPIDQFAIITQSGE